MIIPCMRGLQITYLSSCDSIKVCHMSKMFTSFNACTSFGEGTSLHFFVVTPYVEPCACTQTPRFHVTNITKEFCCTPRVKQSSTAHLGMVYTTYSLYYGDVGDG